jgi:hypothetical protein
MVLDDRTNLFQVPHLPTIGPGTQELRNFQMEVARIYESAFRDRGNHFFSQYATIRLASGQITQNDIVAKVPESLIETSRRQIR